MSTIRLSFFRQQYLILSRYQAGEGIYDLFDKVMILDEGRQVFFGRPSEARAYFEGLGYKALPRQSTGDYLTGCTDPNERQFAPGRSARDTPSTPEALENSYLMSNYSRSNEDSLEKYKLLMDTEKTDQETFRAAVAADKKKGVSAKSPYTLGFIGQVRALTVRRFQTKIQDRFQLYTSFTLAIVRIFFRTICSSLTSCFLRSLRLLLAQPTTTSRLLLPVHLLEEGTGIQHVQSKSIF